MYKKPLAIIYEEKVIDQTLVIMHDIGFCFIEIYFDCVIHLYVGCLMVRVLNTGVSGPGLNPQPARAMRQ